MCRRWWCQFCKWNQRWIHSFIFHWTKHILMTTWWMCACVCVLKVRISMHSHDIDTQSTDSYFLDLSSFDHLFFPLKFVFVMQTCTATIEQETQWHSNDDDFLREASCTTTMTIVANVIDAFVRGFFFVCINVDVINIYWSLFLDHFFWPIWQNKRCFLRFIEHFFLLCCSTHARMFTHLCAHTTIYNSTLTSKVRRYFCFEFKSYDCKNCNNNVTNNWYRF